MHRKLGRVAVTIITLVAIAVVLLYFQSYRDSLRLIEGRLAPHSADQAKQLQGAAR